MMPVAIVTIVTTPVVEAAGIAVSIAEGALIAVSVTVATVIAFAVAIATVIAVSFTVATVIGTAGHGVCAMISVSDAGAFPFSFFPDLAAAAPIRTIIVFGTGLCSGTRTEQDGGETEGY